jgi:hypothetical protein
MISAMYCKSLTPVVDGRWGHSKNLTKPVDIVSKRGAPVSVRQTSRIFRHLMPEIGMEFGELVLSGQCLAV